ncbi:MAG: hypothetical protein HQM11_00025 [SAR324 cluster bacterium]|nr:hypothetical protein [SAR324 cluster bacterium]
MLKLPNIDEVTPSSTPEIVKKLILALQDLADQVGSQDTTLLGAILEAQRSGNERLGRMENRLAQVGNRLERVETTLHAGFQELTSHMDQLAEESRRSREETVDLLRQIAVNTSRNP